MAKTIKSIKCPTCGSAKITEIRKDYYKCDSCGVDFILDNDDININHTYRHVSTSPTVKVKSKKWILGISIFFVMVFLINLFLPTNKTSSLHSVYSVSESNDKEKQFEWYNESKYVFEDKQGNPMLLVVGLLSETRYSDDSKAEVYIGLYDLKTSTKKWIKLLDSSFEIGSSGDIKVRQFEDGNIYITIKNKKIYQLNINDYSINNIGDEYVKNNSDLSVGLAKVEFNHEEYGSCFKIITNDGNQLVYMPLIDKIYKEKDFFNAISTIPPKSEIKTKFVFSSIDSDFPEEKIRLVKYRYKDQYGYPKYNPTFKWQKDFGGSGIFTDRSPYRKSFLTPYMKEKGKVVDYEILAPNRNYFSPRVLASTDDKILINSKPTPAEDELDQIQLLNAKTGEVELSFSPNIKRVSGNNLILKNGGFIINSDKGFIYLDKKGEEINTLYVGDIKENDKK